MQADDLDWVLRGLEKRLAGRPDDEPLALTVGEVRAILREVYEASALPKLPAAQPSLLSGTTTAR